MKIARECKNCQFYFDDTSIKKVGEEINYRCTWRGVVAILDIGVLSRGCSYFVVSDKIAKKCEDCGAFDQSNYAEPSDLYGWCKRIPDHDKMTQRKNDDWCSEFGP